MFARALPFLERNISSIICVFECKREVLEGVTEKNGPVEDQWVRDLG